MMLYLGGKELAHVATDTCVWNRTPIYMNTTINKNWTACASRAELETTELSMLPYYEYRTVWGLVESIHVYGILL